MISGWLESFKAFTPTNNNYLKFIKDNLVVILLFSFMAEGFQHYFLYTDKLTSGTTSLNMMAKFGQVMSSLLTLVFYQLLMPLRLQHDPIGRKEAFWHFAQRQTGPYFLESMRVIGKCLLYLIGGLIVGGLLIMMKHRHDPAPPAFMETANFMQSPAEMAILAICLLPVFFYYVRYTFVPYVTLIDPEYQRGRRDALKHSFKLMTGVTAPVLLVFLALFKIESYRTRLREEYSLMTQPIVAFLLYIPFEMLGIYINILLFYIYQLKQDSFDKSISGGG